MLDASCNETISLAADTWFVYEKNLFSMLGT